MQSRFRRQLLSYLFMLSWLMRDFVWRYRWRVARLMGLRFGGIALQLATFVLLAKYARLLETDSEAALLGETLRARESVLLLGLVGAAALVAMIGGSALIVASTRGLERLCAAYEAFCGKRVLEIAGRSSRLHGPDFLDEDSERLIMKLTKRYPRLLRRMTKALLTSLLPGLVVVAVVLPVLLALNVWLTLLVAGLVAASLSLHYRLSVRAAQSSLTIERTAREATREFKSVVDRIAQSMQPLEPREVDRPYAAGAVRRNLDAYFTRVTATNESQFITDCFTAVILVVVLVTLGGSILRDGEGWATLLVYLLALRYAMAQVRSTLASLAGVNRYFHQARAYLLFLDADHEGLGAGAGLEPGAGDAGGEPAAALESLTVRCTAADPLPHSQPSLIVRPGERIAVLGPFRPSRFQVRALYAALFGECPRTLRAAIARTVLVPDCDVAEQRAGSSAQPEIGRINGSRASQARRRDSAREHAGGLDLVVMSDKTARARKDSSGPGDRSADALAAPWQACIALVSRVAALQQVPCDAIVVTDGESVIWIGTPEDLHLVADALEQRAAGQPGIAGEDGEDELDDDMSGSL
jgi:hypothetical protein